MKLRSPIPARKARIEIIPLIDIMFFLLACFMLVSLSMTHMRGLPVKLPAASSAVPETPAKSHTITVDLLGKVYLGKQPVTRDELKAQVRALSQEDPETRFFIRADRNAIYGEVIRVLDEMKQSGISKVSLELRSVSAPTTEPAASP